MKTIIIKTLLLLLCLSLFSCKKKVNDDYRPEFVGNWYCVPDDPDFLYEIFIDNNSNALYDEVHQSGGDRTIRGKARANDNKLKIGRFTDFKIIDYPHKIDTATSNIIVATGKWSGKSMKANWTMTLKGPLFYMGSGTYYKVAY